MSKFISLTALHRALVHLAEWRHAVDAQGAQHLWIFLSLKRKNVTTGVWTEFGESNDKEFFEEFMHVRATDEPVYDPVAGEFRIATHYHSNVATARKNTFANRWHIIEPETPARDQSWRFVPNYLDLVQKNLLTKAKRTTKIPLFDLLAWLYRTKPFPDTVRTEDLVNQFRVDFHITDAELGALFAPDVRAGIPILDSQLFASVALTTDLILYTINHRDSFDIAEVLAMEAGPNPSVTLDDVVTIARQGRKQLILQGPPGTSKTFVALQVAARLLGADSALVNNQLDFDRFLDERQFSRLHEQDTTMTSLPAKVVKLGGTWDIVQFHPNYNYEDFVRGITARIQPSGTPSFHVENRIFGSLAAISRQVDVPVILIVDEINRGDIAKVLGELIYALEYRGHAVHTLYTLDDSALLSVGQNFYLIATMNTADRSIALIDYAIRRRFDFVELRPDRAVLERYLQENAELEPYTPRVLALFDQVVDLFASAPDYAVGHTYFMGRDIDDVARRVMFQLLPLLAEYQKERILSETQSLTLPREPMPLRLPFTHPRPFALLEQLREWLDASQPRVSAPTPEGSGTVVSPD